MEVPLMAATHIAGRQTTGGLQIRNLSASEGGDLMRVNRGSLPAG
jgi:hypothetical protein